MEGEREKEKIKLELDFVDCSVSVNYQEGARDDERQNRKVKGQRSNVTDRKSLSKRLLKKICVEESQKP